MTVRLPLKFAVRPLDDSAPLPAMILRGPVAMAVRSTGANPGDLLREPDLERSLVPSAGEPLTYRPRSGAELLVRPFYAFKQDERYSLYLDPNHHSHREARFTGDGWRESEAFRYDDRPGDSAAFAFRGTASAGSASASTTPASPRSASTTGRSSRSTRMPPPRRTVRVAKG